MIELNVSGGTVFRSVLIVVISVALAPPIGGLAFFLVQAAVSPRHARLLARRRINENETAEGNYPGCRGNVEHRFSQDVEGGHDSR